MKILSLPAFVSKLTRASGVLLIAAGLAITYSSTTAFAQTEKEVDGGPPGGTCTVCHKNRQTLTLPCNDIALRRHQAHGDTPGPCPSSRSVKETEKEATDVRTAQTAEAAPVQEAKADDVTTSKASR